MSAKKKRRITIYTDEPDFNQEQENTLPPEEQNLRVRLETKNRKGKAVTLIYGFIGTDDDLEDLSKALKQYCGVGGSAKDGEIIIQGDQRDKVCQYFEKNNYGFKKG